MNPIHIHENNFLLWLAMQCARNDEVGDLGRDLVEAELTGAHELTKTGLRRYLREHGCHDALAAYKEALLEYRDEHRETLRQARMAAMAGAAA